MTKNPFWPSGRSKGWSLGGRAPNAFSQIRPAQNPGLSVTGIELAPTLKANERGAILMPDVKISGSGTTVSIGESLFNPDVTRASLLLFDRLDSPANTFMQLGPEIPPGLEDWTGYQRSRIGIEGTLTKEIFELTLLTAFEELNSRESGFWSVARAANSMGLPPKVFGGPTAFKIKLENALPIPDRSVSYDEVLSYKERRKSELVSLRHHLEGLVLDVAPHGFGGFAESLTFEKFSKALDDYVSTMKEENFLKRLTSLDISFNWSEAIVKGIATIPIGQIFPNLGSSAFFLAAASSFSIESTLGLRKKSATPSPFDYVFRAKNEM